MDAGLIVITAGLHGMTIAASKAGAEHFANSTDKADLAKAP